jgi:hypothetical protein
MLNRHYDVALPGEDEPDTPSAINFAGRQSRPDQVVTPLWRYPTSTRIPRQFARSIAMPENQVERTACDAAPLGLLLCVR